LRRGRAGASSLKIDLTEKLVAWSAAGAKLFALAFLVSAAYILYGVYGGHLRGEIEPRIMNNLRLMGQIMALSGGLGTICLVIITFEEAAWSVVVGLFGLGLIFGLPLMVAGQVTGGGERAAELIMQWADIAGKFIVLVVGIRMLIEVVSYIREAPLRQAQATDVEGVAKAKHGIARPWWWLQRCWEMPYCHDAIKEVCPAFKARKNCWRIRQGCNCDAGMIEALIRSGGAARGKGAEAKRGTQEAYVRSDLQSDIKIGQGERTRECRNCPIFHEHQRPKFQLLNPIFIIATIVGLLAAYPIMQRLYRAAIQFMSKLASTLAYGETLSVSDWISRLDSPAVWVFFYIIVGLLVLSYALKLVEWAILVRKVL